MTADSTSAFRQIGLLVTGEGEREFLDKLFRLLMDGGNCTFKVAGKVPQRGPLTSQRQILKMAGSGKRITSLDEKLGLSARKCFSDIPYAAMSETSLNCWKLSVIRVFSCSAWLVGRLAMVASMAA